MNNFNRRHYLLFPFLLFLIQCETPEDPNFTLSQKIDAPIIAESNFVFMGEKNALIDTTSEDLSGLFSADGDNFITLIKEESFSFDDLDNAIPEISVDPTQFEAEVGEIALSNFSSQDENGNLGQAGFSDLTGVGVTPEEGDPIPGAQSPFPVEIDLDTDFFESATIRQGAVQITLSNELGFNIDRISIDLLSSGSTVSSGEFTGFAHNTDQTLTLSIVEDPQSEPEVVLSNLSVQVEIEWSSQTMQSDAGNLIVNSAGGENLIASEVVAAIPQQEFTLSGSTSFDDSDFMFSSEEHYVQLQSGTLDIQNILNGIDVDIPVLQLSFPNIRNEPWGESDSLVITFDGNNFIGRANTQPASQSIDLTGMRIYAPGNDVEYSISAVTEDTRQSGSPLRTIRETDAVSAEIAISNLVLQEAFGVPLARETALNSDDPANGVILDLLNDVEAEIIEIDGIRDLSQKVTGIEFTNASLDIRYSTNTNLPVRVVGAFLGRDSSGDTFYLSGDPGTSHSVTDNSGLSRLTVNGTQIAAENLIQFELNHSGDPNDTEVITFDRENTNINEFFSKLPNEIRFIGLAFINESETEGVVRNPLLFEPEFRVNVPLSIRTDLASFADTISQDLGNLPGPDDDESIEEGQLYIQYGNRIPIGFSVQLEFLDENDDLLMSVPMQGEPAIDINPAPTNPGGASDGTRSGTASLNLNRQQLDLINQTRNIRIAADILTREDEVSIRGNDDVTISISGSFSILTTID
ncbi:hypothetical protein [Rhodohalobacter halophilus]|uniref:hypothetical protein n=1 Tax=Rhodohalobacter halophilus TaxID=1812810 RepID=UPI00083F71B0|nr:hypothetical protein [Rhodohalobacter halophilus]